MKGYPNCDLTVHRKEPHFNTHEIILFIR